MFQAYRPRKVASWTTLAFAAAVFAGPCAALADGATSPEGIWYTKNQESIIRVHACADHADAFCGTLVWLKEPSEKDGSAKLDQYNPDAGKRSKPIIGTDILLHMKEDGDHWKGNAYNPEDGKTYDITLKVKNNKGENDAADLRGCVFGFLCRTEMFTRASNVPGEAYVADAGKKRKAAKHDAKAPTPR